MRETVSEFIKKPKIKQPKQAGQCMLPYMSYQGRHHVSSLQSRLAHNEELCLAEKPLSTSAWCWTPALRRTIKKRQKQLPDLIQNKQKSRLIFFCLWRPRTSEKDGGSARRNERRKSNFDASFKNWHGRSQPEMSNYRPERFSGKRLKTKIASENDLLVSLPVCQLPPFWTNDPRDTGTASGRNSQAD